MEEQELTVKVNDETFEFKLILDAISRLGMHFGKMYIASYFSFVKYEVIDNNIHFYYKSDDDSSIYTLIVCTSSLLKREGITTINLSAEITNPITGLKSEYDVGILNLFYNIDNKSVKDPLDRIYTNKNLVVDNYNYSLNSGKSHVYRNFVNRVRSQYKPDQYLAVQLHTDLINSRYNMGFKLNIVDIDDPDSAIIALHSSQFSNRNLGEFISHYIIKREVVKKETNSNLFMFNYDLYKVTTQTQGYIESENFDFFKERYGAIKIGRKMYHIINGDVYRDIYTQNGSVEYSDVKHIISIEDESKESVMKYYNIFKWIMNDLNKDL